MASNSDRRLDRLYGALTPKERATLVLRAWKEGREPDTRLIRASRSEQEAHEYNRLIDLLRTAGSDLTHYLACLHLLVGQLELRFSWLLCARAWGHELRAPDPRVDEMADALRRQLGEGTAANWRQLGALAQVLTEIAEEVDGEDVLHPAARALLDRTRAQLQDLHEEMARRREGGELTEPTPEEVECVRALVERAGGLLNAAASRL